MQYKICSKCKVDKPYSDYHKNKSTSTGIVSMCKPCNRTYQLAYARTREGLVRNIYSEQKESSKVRELPLPNYNAPQLVEWVFAQPEFNNLYIGWVDSNYDKWKRPSTDRINNWEPYRLDNLQMVTFRENNERSHKDAREGNNLNSQLIPVDQYSLSGDYLKTFKSLAEAERVTGISVGAICTACRKKNIAAAKYLWKYSSDPVPPKYQSLNKFVYLEMDAEGNEVGRFDSSQDLKVYLGRKDLSPFNKALRLGRKYLGVKWERIANGT